MVDGVLLKIHLVAPSVLFKIVTWRQDVVHIEYQITWYVYSAVYRREITYPYGSLDIAGVLFRFVCKFKLAVRGILKCVLYSCKFAFGVCVVVKHHRLYDWYTLMPWTCALCSQKSCCAICLLHHVRILDSIMIWMLSRPWLYCCDQEFGVSDIFYVVSCDILDL